MVVKDFSRNLSYGIKKALKPEIFSVCRRMIGKHRQQIAGECMVQSDMFIKQCFSKSHISEAIEGGSSGTMSSEFAYLEISRCVRN